MRYPEKRDENAVELESQFILRMPPEPSRILRELIRSGVTNFKDRVSIRLENDVRYGEVRVDHYLLHAKVVDLPTVIESLKTIDNKSFYKTADICQLMICKEEEDQTTTDDETPSKNKKKDPNKVDKKFLWPHGVTPPLKNVRRRRFRKTLKKKFVEQPEIEKEVKRLLRIDNDAVSVTWEVIADEEEQKPCVGKQNKDSGIITIKNEKERVQRIKTEPNTAGSSVDVAEQEIFGSAVSDSEDENINVMDIDESSRLTGDDSRIYDSDSQGRGSSALKNSTELITEFTKDMFSNLKHIESIKLEHDHNIDIKDEPIPSTGYAYDLYKHDTESLKSENSTALEYAGLTRDQIVTRMTELQAQISDLRMRQQQQEIEITNIENQALRQRLQDILDRLIQKMYEKELELQDLQALL